MDPTLFIGTRRKQREDKEERGREGGRKGGREGGREGEKVAKRGGLERERKRNMNVDK